jgi:hypothetical protein
VSSVATAAEPQLVIELLPHRAAEARFLQAGDVQRVAAVRERQFGGMRAHASSNKAMVFIASGC